MKSKISIIVPIYKVEKYLPKCIESILNQSFKDFELILVNDGSPDRCGKICEEYSKIDNRIKVIHKDNGGLSSARNVGISIATGDYIAFVDSDDFIHCKMYELLYKCAIDNSSDIVICDYYVINEDAITDADTLRYRAKIGTQNFTNIAALKELYETNGVKFVVAWNKLYRRNLFEELRYEQGRIHEDEFIAHKLLFASSKVTYLPIKLYFYIQTISSITRSSYNIKRLDAVYALKDRANFFKKIKQKDLQYKAEVRYIQTLFLHYRKIRINNIIAYKEIRSLRKDLFKKVKTLINNPYFNKKEKTVWLIFIINPLLYDWFISMKEINKTALDTRHRA